MTAQKCKKYMVAGSIERFLISWQPKIKENQVYQKDYTEQKARIGGSRELLLSSSELKYFSTESFQIKA